MIEIIYDNKLIELGFAKQFQSSINNGSLIKFQKEKDKKILLNIQSEQFLIITSIVDSIKTIISVEEYNEQYIKQLFENGS